MNQEPLPTRCKVHPGLLLEIYSPAGSTFARLAASDALAIAQTLIYDSRLALFFKPPVKTL